MKIKRHVTSAFLVSKHGDALREAYGAGGATVTMLVKDYNCSRNTMTLALGRLGFPVPKWAKDRLKAMDKKRKV
jgi:hypothetical protein